MKILYFSEGYTTHDRHFLEKLAESKHEIWFLALKDYGIKYETRPVPEKIQLVNWQCHHKAPKAIDDYLGLMHDFTNIIRQIQPDIIHAGPVQSCGFMVALADFHPFLAMSWGSDLLLDSDKNRLWKWLTQYTLDHSDMLQCDCSSVREKAKEMTNYQDERIIQFPWGVDLNIFKPHISNFEIKNSLGWSDSEIILSTRSLEPIYGIDVLLSAFKSAYHKNKKLRLMLLGSGSLAKYVKKYINDNCLCDAIYAPGRIPNDQLPVYHANSDIYLSCSFSDGSSISLLEAMAMGSAPIVTDLPANREWIASERNGWLVPPSDIEAFSDTILKVARLSNDELMNISRINRHIIETKADWNRNFNMLLTSYEKLRLH